MIRYTLFSIVLSIQSFLILNVQAKENNNETFDTFIQQVFNNNESLSLAKINITRTNSEIHVIESTLGWNLFANVGVNRNRSFIGAESTQSNLLLGVNKSFESGNSIELKTNYRHDDSEYIVINSQPNPLTTTGVDLNYRIPLMQNKKHNEYLLNLDSVNSKYSESINTKLLVRDEITAQAIDLFYGAAVLIARLKTARESIERAKKLKLHINKNIDLGIVEKGEILQANAQIHFLQGQYQELNLVWEKSEIAINRLIGKPWNSRFIPKVKKTKNKKYKFDSVHKNIKQYNPELKILNLNLKLADSIIVFNKDSTRSKLDLVFSIGTINNQGPTAVGGLNETDVIGGITLEYQKSLDRRGLNGKLYQAHLNRDSIKIQISKLETDLEYDSYALISNIKKITAINITYKERSEIEVDKYKDIVNRYRSGRTTTNIVIQFDNERTAAELDYETQNILLEKNISLLNLKQGKLFFRKNGK